MLDTAFMVRLMEVVLVGAVSLRVAPPYQTLSALASALLSFAWIPTLPPEPAPGASSASLRGLQVLLAHLARNLSGVIIG